MTKRWLGKLSGFAYIGFFSSSFIFLFWTGYLSMIWLVACPFVWFLYYSCIVDLMKRWADWGNNTISISLVWNEVKWRELLWFGELERKGREIELSCAFMREGVDWIGASICCKEKRGVLSLSVSWWLQLGKSLNSIVMEMTGMHFSLPSCFYARKLLFV